MNVSLQECREREDTFLAGRSVTQILPSVTSGFGKKSVTPFLAQPAVARYFFLLKIFLGFQKFESSNDIIIWFAWKDVVIQTFLNVSTFLKCFYRSYLSWSQPLIPHSPFPGSAWAAAPCEDASGTSWTSLYSFCVLASPENDVDLDLSGG